MGEFLGSHICQHHEVAPHTTLYVFENQVPRFNVVVLRQKLYIKSKSISQMENTCNKLRLRIYFIPDMANRLGGRRIRERE